MSDRLFPFIMMMLLLASCSEPKPKLEVTSDFNSGWEFCEAGTDEWLSAEVPGCVQLDLIRHGLLEDPRIDSNEVAAQWVEEKEWIYRKSFKKKDLPERRVFRVDFEGLDTYCDIYVNGEQKGVSKNMFVPQSIYLTRDSLPAENVLELRFKSTLNEGTAVAGNRKHGLTAGNDIGAKRVSPFVRKAPYQFGWDWGPRVVTTGIWKGVLLKGLDVDFEIRPTYSYRIDSLGTVKGSIRLEYCCPDLGYEVLIQGPWGLMKDSIRPQSCPSYVYREFELDAPELWSIGTGQQDYYTASIEVFNKGMLIHEDELKMYFRDIQLVHEQDSIGTAFYFKLNDDPIFIKGANYIPQSMFPSEVTDADYRRSLTQAKTSNINMLRVWGGGIYEKDIFYELCDSLGILVWQDFMFAGAMYPSDDAFIYNVEDEITAQHRRLEGHPCIATWCGNNEVDVAWKNWGWQGVMGTDSVSMQADYDRLFKEALGQTMYGSNYVHTSPFSNWGKEENFDHSNMHYWGVWHGSDDFDGFEKYVPRFMSEYGFQSFPMPSTFEGQVSQDQLQVDSPIMRHRQKSYKGTKELIRHLEQHYPMSKDFERFCFLSQLNQAYAMGKAIHAHRTSGGHCMGTLYWQLNDVWAGPTWSTIDVKGNWKVAHYTVKDRYKDVIVTSKEEGELITISVVNDSDHKLDAQLHMDQVFFDGNKTGPMIIDIDMRAHSDSLIVRAPTKAYAWPEFGRESSCLRLRLMEGGSLLDEWTHYFCPPKDLVLQPMDDRSFSIEPLDRNRFRITAHIFLKDFFLHLPDTENAYWSDNGFDLLPGESREVQFLGNEIIGDIRVLTLNGVEPLLGPPL